MIKPTSRFRSHFRFWLFLAWVSLGPLAFANSQTGAPAALDEWQDWVLHQQPELGCPALFDSDNRACQWLGELQINAVRAGATFSQEIEVYAESRFYLPGSSGLWPESVTANNSDVPVIADERGMPFIMLATGNHQISGVFNWPDTPQFLPINPLTGLIRLFWDGQLVANPERQQNQLSLSQATTATSTQPPQNKLDMTVVRLVRDGHPLMLDTTIIMEVAGFQREVVLGKPLLDGLTPLSLISGGLPAQLNNDGGLRVQVRPGRWEIALAARSTLQPDSLTLIAQPAPWPSEEVWAYASSNQHRVTTIDGVAQIDPRQSKLPQPWQRWPAYLVNGGDTLRINTTQIDSGANNPDQLQLQRAIWLDFDGKGYSLRDRLNGSLQNSWRLEISQPLELQSAKINDLQQFITTINNGESSGVEVRQGQLDLQADSRLDASTRKLPANGWDIDFQSVDATLNTPPGWQVLTVKGVDNIPGAWLSRWTVYKVFLLLVTVLAIGKLWRWPWAAVALLAFIPLWLELSIFAYVILPVLVFTALSRLLPEHGAISHWIRFARMASLLVLALVIVPFMVQQARNSIFPQLERYGDVYTHYDDRLQERAVDMQSDFSKAARGSASVAIYSDDASSPKQIRRKLSTQIDPSLIAQTGEGLPDWQWKSTHLSWNGPVLRDQHIDIIMLSPAQVFFIRFAALALLAWLLWRLLDIKPGGRGRWWVAPVAVAAMSGNANADFPPENLLNELSNRLQATSIAAPRASIDEMHLTVVDRQLTASVVIHAVADTAIPLPFHSEQLLPGKVTHEDSDDSALLFTQDDGYLWVQVGAGIHSLKVEVYLPDVDQFQMPMALYPHHVTVDSEDWIVRGLDKNAVPTGQLSFVRKQSSVEQSSSIKPSVLPAFFKITRQLSLGIQWQVITTIVRQDNNNRGETLNVPLIDGETVITDGIDIENNIAVADFGLGTRQVQFQSVLHPQSRISLTAANLPNALEVWQLDAGTMWHVQLEGITPIYNKGSGSTWQPNWHPWPGQQISVDVTRPNGIAGASMSIENSSLEWRPGSRITEGELTLSILSSRGLQHPVVLPSGAELQSVVINNKEHATSAKQNTVSLPVQPGSQRAVIRWRQPHPISNVWTSPSPNVGVKHVNAKLRVQMPTDRWVVWLDGPRLGPAVVIWGLLVIMLFLATALGEASRGRVPAGALTWLFIGLGLSQLSILALIPIAIWLFLLHIRARLRPVDMKPYLFNTLQLSIVFMTFFALVVLLQAVQTGLLGYPQMQIQGNGSGAHLFNWYQDRADASYPQARIYSVPLIFYRSIMLVWALWLAYTLIKWLQWGWQAFSNNGLWKKSMRKQKKTAS